MTSSTYWGARGRITRRGLIAASAVGVAAVAAGCGDDDTPKVTATAARPTATPVGGAPASSASASAAASPTATPAKVDLTRLNELDFFQAIPDNIAKDWQDSQIKPGGRLVRLAIPQFTTFDPLTTVQQGNGELYQAIYNKLIRFSCRQGMKSTVLPEIEPDLAQSWERPDPTTLVFKLAPNIKWQNVAPLNGRAFTADDVAYSFNRVKTMALSAHKATFANFESVTGLPDGRVQVKLARPDLTAEELLSQYFASIVPREVGDDTTRAQTSAVGTGGMILKSYTPNVEVVFDKNPDFFKTDAQGRKKPYLDGYTLQFLKDAATIRNVFETRKGDFTYGLTLPVTFDTLYEFYKRYPEVDVQMYAQGTPSWTLTPRAQQAPWNDPRVRKALNMAIPREKLVKSLFKGRAVVHPFFPWPFIMERPPTLDSLGPNYKYDPKEAKALLSAAGFANGLDFEIWYYPSTETVTVALQQEIAESGFRAKLQKDPDVATNLKRLQTRDWKDVLTAGRALRFVSPAATWTVYVKGTSDNFSDYTDPKFEELWTKFNAATSIAAQKEVGKEMWTAMLDQVPDVAYPAQHSMYIQQPWVENIVNTSWGSISGAGLGQMDSVWRSA